MSALYRKWYPPARLLFYPLYRRLRHRWRMPCAAAYLAVWMISGALHGSVLLAFSNPLPALVFTLIFIGLGLAGVVAISLKHRQRRRRAAMGATSPSVSERH